MDQEQHSTKLTDVINEITTEIYLKYANLSNPIFSAAAIRHTAMVETSILLIAKKRDINVNEARLVAVLHDVGKYLIKPISIDHAKASAKYAQDLLDHKSCFSQESKDRICHAICEHSNKSVMSNDMLSEALKDADTLAYYLESPDSECSSERLKRLEHLEEEGIIQQLNVSNNK